MRTWLSYSLALVPALATGAIWYVAASRLMYRLGPNEAATAVGLLTAVGVTLTMLRWTRSE